MNNILYDLGLEMSFAFEDGSETKPRANTDALTIWDVNLSNTILVTSEPSIKEKTDNPQIPVAKQRLLN